MSSGTMADPGQAYSTLSNQRNLPDKHAAATPIVVTMDFYWNF